MSADRINYVGSALASLDQALNTDPAMLSRNDAAARAQAFALLAIADELRQIRDQRPPTVITVAGKLTPAEVERIREQLRGDA